jgi:hypothetical protein
VRHFIVSLNLPQLPASNCSNRRTARLRWGFHAWNSSAALDASCLSHFANSPWKCMLASNAALFLGTPVFIVNSVMDSCQVNAPPFLFLVQNAVYLIYVSGQRLQPRRGLVRSGGLDWAL